MTGWAAVVVRPAVMARRVLSASCAARGCEEARITREVFGGDVLAEMRAWRDGVHPLKQTKRGQTAV